MTAQAQTPTTARFARLATNKDGIRASFLAAAADFAEAPTEDNHRRVERLTEALRVVTANLHDAMAALTLEDLTPA
jgi:hypothetical protein